jgi:hypothetical protein
MMEKGEYLPTRAFNFLRPATRVALTTIVKLLIGAIATMILSCQPREAPRAKVEMLALVLSVNEEVVFRNGSAFVSRVGNITCGAHWI